MHDIVGQWHFGPNIAEFNSDSTFILHVADGRDLYGTYQIAEASQITGGTAGLRKQLVEVGGEFLLLTHKQPSGAVGYYELMKVEERKPNRLVLSMPDRQEDGSYRRKSHEVLRCDR